MVKFDKKDLLYGTLLVVIVLVTRFCFSVDDNVAFTDGTGHMIMGSKLFSLVDQSPQLPGYYLYVKLVKIFAIVTGSPHQSMLLLSVLFSMAGAIFFYRIARYFTDELNSFLLTLLIFTNPFVWFQGCISEIFAFNLFLGSLLVFAGMNSKWIYATPPILGLGLGVSLSGGLLMVPALVWLWYLHHKREGILWVRLTEFSSLALVLMLMWVIPMVRSVEGDPGYLGLWDKLSPLAATGFTSGLSYMVGTTWSLLIPFATIALWFVLRTLKGKPLSLKAFYNENKNEIIMMALWLVPAMFIFVVRSYNPGDFLLVAGVPFMFYVLAVKHGFLKMPVIIAVIALQAILFFVFPYNEPTDEMNFNSRTCKMGGTEMWTDRVMSDYSMSYNRIRAYNGYYAEVLSGLRNSRDFMVNNSKYFYVVDPSCLVQARTFQTVFPQKTFATLKKSNMKLYHSYNENELRETTDPYYLVKNAMIITKRSFYEKYLRGIAEPPYKVFDNYVFLVGNDRNALQFLEVYKNYYEEIEN